MMMMIGMMMGKIKMRSMMMMMILIMMEMWWFQCGVNCGCDHQRYSVILQIYCIDRLEL